MTDELKKNYVASSKEIAKRFQKLRNAHQTETIEDYVEMIHVLSKKYKDVKSVDLAKCFGVSQPNINKNISKLKEHGLVISEPYRSIELTNKGIKLAKFCYQRHNIIIKFLKSIGVTEQIANIDAEGIEHHVSEETLSKMKKHIEKK